MFCQCPLNIKICWRNQRREEKERGGVRVIGSIRIGNIVNMKQDAFKFTQKLESNMTVYIWRRKLWKSLQLH